MESASIAGFFDFCKKNILLIITVTIALFFTYGIKLFWYSIGIDTITFMADKAGQLKWSMQIGRFGYVLLAKLLFIKEFNPFTAFFTAFCLIWFFTVSWCYLFAVFSRDTGKNNNFIPFALVLMTSPIWASQFYFLHQAAENAFIISLCPCIIYLLYKGFLDNRKGRIIFASVLLVFIISVYQGIIPLFCCGTFACFLLFQKNSDYEPKVYRNLCIKLLITLAASVAVYFFIDRIIIPPLFHIERANYIDSMNKWGQKSFVENVFKIVFFGYIIMGQIPFVHNIANQIMTNYIGPGAVGFIANTSRVFGNILLLPVTVFFFIGITAIVRKTIPSGRRLLYVLAGIGVPLTIMLLAVMGGSVPPMRSVYALPLAFSFMFFFLIGTYRKKAAVIVTCLALITAMYQAQISAQLFYSDQMRYNEDVRFAYELNNLITRAQPNNKNLPVAIAGNYDTASRFHSNFLEGEEVGRSVFGAGGSISQSTVNGLAFMKSLGINFDVPDNDQLEKALKEAAYLFPYPDPGCIKRTQDFIVIRISDNLY